MIQGREKDKKIKPMKQPVKPLRPLHPTQKQATESNLGKDSLHRSKLPASMTSSLPTNEPKINTLESVCSGLL